MKGAVFIFLSVIIGCLGYQAQATDLHGKRVFLRAWSETEAFEFSDGPMNSSIWSRGELLQEATPDLLPLSLHHEDGSRLSGMLLQRNYRVEHPMKITYHGVEEYAPLLPKGSAMYHDALSGAVVGLKNKKGRRHFDGSFEVEGTRYELHPDTEGSGARGFEEHVAHIITRSESPTVIDSELYAKLKSKLDKEMESDDTEERIDSGTDYSPELAIVVDYSEYVKWEKLYKSEKCAIKMLKYKFSYIYNAMDRLLKTFKKDGEGFSVTLILKHLKIITDQSDSAVLDKFNLKGTPIDPLKPWETELDGTGLLSYLKTWGPRMKMTMDNYDSVMYYHNYKMRGAVGWAYTSAVCGSNGVSTVRDHGFETWTTATHELGHTLGAGHDTASSGECAAKLMHIMTVSWGAFSGKFSPCSIRSIKSTLARKRCLKDVSDNYQLPEMSLAGKKFNADWQCKWVFPLGHFKQFNVDLEEVKQCSDPSSADCNRGLRCGGVRASGYAKGDTYCKGTGVMYLAADGTPCGQGKMCYHEQCVSE